MLVPRNLAGVLSEIAQRYPVVTLTGPRQSGKTTLCRKTFPEKTDINLERLDDREYASSDPRGFIAAHSQGAALGVDCKSGATIASDALAGLERLGAALGSTCEPGRPVLVYGGKQRQKRTGADVVPWSALDSVDWVG